MNEIIPNKGGEASGEDNNTSNTAWGNLKDVPFRGPDTGAEKNIDPVVNIDKIIESQNNSVIEAEQKVERLKAMGWKIEMTENADKMITKAEKELEHKQKNIAVENSVLDSIGYNKSSRTMQTSDLVAELIESSSIISENLSKQGLSAEERKNLLAEKQACIRLINRYSEKE